MAKLFLPKILNDYIKSEDDDEKQQLFDRIKKFKKQDIKDAMSKIKTENAQSNMNTQLEDINDKLMLEDLEAARVETKTKTKKERKKDRIRQQATKKIRDKQQTDTVEEVKEDNSYKKSSVAMGQKYQNEEIAIAKADEYADNQANLKETVAINREKARQVDKLNQEKARLEASEIKASEIKATWDQRFATVPKQTVSALDVINDLKQKGEEKATSRQVINAYRNTCDTATTTPKTLEEAFALFKIKTPVETFIGLADAEIQLTNIYNKKIIECANDALKGLDLELQKKYKYNIDQAYHIIKEQIALARRPETPEQIETKLARDQAINSAKELTVQRNSRLKAEAEAEAHPCFSAKNTPTDLNSAYNVLGLNPASINTTDFKIQITNSLTRYKILLFSFLIRQIMT